MGEFVQCSGDYYWTAEKLPDGTYKYLRQLRNTPGVQFEEVLSLEEVPQQIIQNRKYLAETAKEALARREATQARNRAAG